MRSATARLGTGPRRDSGRRRHGAGLATLLGWPGGTRERRAPTPRSLSDAIGFARLALITGLVFLHYGAYPGSTTSPFDGFDPQRHVVATFANSFVLFFFFSVVPVLGMVSGWLFFGFGAADAKPALGSRIRHRARSLYLPLLAWNGVYLLAAILAYRLWPQAGVLGALNIDPATAGPREFIDAVAAITGHPVAFQFWFVRDLLLAVLASPLLWAGMRFAPLPVGALLALVWLSGHDLWIFFRTDVLFFFYLGGLLRWHGAALDIPMRTTSVLLGVYLALLIARVLAPAVIDIVPDRPGWLDVATRAMRLVGVGACWGLCLQLSRTATGRWLARYAGLAFFLFATHFPVIAVVKAVSWPWLPAVTDGWMVVHYVGSVTTTLVVCLSAGLVLARAAPRWFALMNGGRLLPRGDPAAPPEAGAGAPELTR